MVASAIDPTAPIPDTAASIAEREQMVARQLRARDITDERVLAAMAAVPRHALMSQLLALRGDERVLEIGTGSGYQAAVLSYLAQAVYSIEIDPELAARARATLAALGRDRVSVRVGDGYYGWPSAAPFDAIIITAAVPRLPTALLGQLREGGRVVAPLERRDGEELAVGVRHGNRVEWTSHGGVRFVPMTGTVRKTP